MVVIKNLSQKKTISKEAKIASSFLDQLCGLLNPHNPRFLILYTRFGIHTIFLKSPIDVMLINEKKRVVVLKKGLSPNHVFFYSPRYSTVVEMPAGSIDKYSLCINDKISIA